MLLSLLVRTMFWPSVTEMAIKVFNDTVPLSKPVRDLSSLAMRDYEDDSEEVSKGCFLVGTEDVLDIDEVPKYREGIPG